jgi:hypothetical protein
MAVDWYPIEQARKDGTRYILFAPKTRLGTYTGSWMLRWGIIDGQKVQCEGWWLDGFEAPSQPTLFTDVPPLASSDTTSP